MSDLIRREDAIKQIEYHQNHKIINKIKTKYALEMVKSSIEELPTAEPTIDDIAEQISNTDWYHIFKGELRHGAHDREEALFKAEDIFNVLKDMGASEEYTDQEMERSE